MKKFNLKTMLLMTLLSITSAANAAFITIDEVGMDAIFSQVTFGNTPVDIRIGASIEHVDPDLLNMNTGAKWATLTSNHYGAANTVNFWFLDDLSWCGNINVNYVGCGETPGNDFVVESIFASGPSNAELLAHELGHNLGLGHNGGATSLMNAFINGGTDLSAGEVTTIMNSSLVQTDVTNGQRFINILPILIVAQATPDIPEPETMVLMLLSLVLLGRKRVFKS